jgi:hypothetical protein
MGGRGSGRIFRWDSKTVLEECRFIDIRDWKRRDLIRDGYGFSWSWWQDGAKKASIWVLTASDFVRVEYSVGGARTHDNICRDHLAAVGHVRRFIQDTTTNGTSHADAAASRIADPLPWNWKRPVAPPKPLPPWVFGRYLPIKYKLHYAVALRFVSTGGSKWNCAGFRVPKFLLGQKCCSAN